MDIPCQRLLSQRLTGARLAHPAEVVRWMGAMQAQDYAQALWAVGLRTNGASLADVERAIDERKIVWTWPLRGTLHFAPAEDVRWMRRLSAPRTLAAGNRRLVQLGLDDGTIEECGRLFQQALAGGKRLTRQAMMALLTDAGINPQGQRGYHILWHLSQTGLICLGPLAGKQQTFVLLDEWVPAAHEIAREEALAELAGRYFASHGPATLPDLARWAGLTLTDARAGLDATRSRLTSATVGGNEYWMSAELAVGVACEAPSVLLLPGFDEYLLGYKDRDAVLAAEHAEKVVPGKNGIFLPTVVVAGQVVGTWKRTVKRNAVEIAVTPFSRIELARERIIEAAERYAAFTGLSLSRVAV